MLRVRCWESVCENSFLFLNVLIRVVLIYRVLSATRPFLSQIYHRVPQTFLSDYQKGEWFCKCFGGRKSYYSKPSI